MLKKFITGVFLICLSTYSLQAAYLNKFVKIIVHTKPGSSGLLALANVYNEKADGYTLLAFPAAYLAPIQTTNVGFGLDDFEYHTFVTIVFFK